MSKREAKIWFKSGYKHKLDQLLVTRCGSWLVDFGKENDFVYARNGILFQSAGYCWNGTNAIRDTPKNIRASCVHDGLYQAIRALQLGKNSLDYQDPADQLFARICIEAGLKPWIAWRIAYPALRAFGKKAARPKSEPKVHQAP